ncbi:MAG: DUF927 domain-containing protein, partial [Chloroflexota bacterium]
RMGNNRELSLALKQAEALNREGYGAYFAPCLRKAKQGKAEAAALVPALWVDIDCDGDTHQREQNLMKLKDFDPAPSFIIDSGGGWHGYWLLDESFHLQGDTDRQKIAAILRGLFSDLDGDPEYVKTVAGIMRLPDSVSTKPERDGVGVTVVESYPERRYPLATFAWLESQPRQPSFDGLKVVTLNGNGHHPLPPRTETYLASGVTDGNRNTELFAAACQLRDAGYSQSDTERELIPRHLINGSSEREALATIKSAYSRPARDPILVPREQARQQVGQLVSEFAVEQKAERPTTERIVAAIEACIHLNPVEWAEERQRLKAVCGDGLKIGDIDRLFKEKKRASFQQREQEYLDAESYLLRDGKIIYRKESYRGMLEKTVVDWTATALYQTCQVDDDGKEAHTTALELRRGEFVKKLDVPGDVFVDDVALRRFIGANAGSQYVVRAGMSKHLVPAIVQLSGEFPTHRHYNFMGWMELDGRWVYVSPQDCITAKGKLSEPPSVELDHRLRDYGLQATGWNESLAAFDAVTKVLPPKLASSLIAFALLPVLQRFFPAAAPRPAVHLVGTLESGKSEIASLLSSFYGQFSRDTPPAQWGDTINTVETLGYPLADSLFWVDDYKSIYADEKTFTRFLQSYSRGMGRGRLTREAKVRHEKPCRGLILSTGETTIEGEMSVVARMLVLEIPPWEKRDPGGQTLVQAEHLREHLPGFTAHFASWVAKQLETGDLKTDIANRFSSNMRGYREKLAAEIGRQSNTGRVIQNWAVLVTVYQMLSRFLAEMDKDYLIPAWRDAIVESVRTLRQERASEVFLDILGQLIAGGQAVIDDDMKNPREYPPSVTVVGYKDEGFVYLLPEIAHREVNRVQPLRFTVTAIGMQLREDSILIPGPNNLSTQKRVRGSRVRFWQLTSESFVETVEPPETASR